jgi:hypothetical protein
MKLKSIPKRYPKTKAGRLLVYTAQRLMFIVSKDYELYGTISDGAVKIINRLIDRIQGRLDRELEIMYPQVALFQNYTVTFIRPKRKRATTQRVSASDKQQAIRLIREQHGKTTKIINTQ